MDKEIRKPADQKAKHESDVAGRLDADKDDVEFATSYGAPLSRDMVNDRKDQDVGVKEDNGRALGITGLIISIISFFLWPFILAPAGIIIGGIAIRRGSTFGWWAVGIGLLSLIIMTIALPFRIIF
ncbi:hypothetical protein [Thermoflavimicrobium dichotomicum]|uniref:DUF4190 domain-containing protein n=1 Tax=Thermoflavimicrobium dichotomicum TaxID=46223 RepID=A0A1I3NG19_9BACL|nr:hypothetical protein [Thermoflavimicrobium dichotomicum]SFJ07756.1 hypothetical protein SAMN05421852_104112 [Thermoflavimicrobium dichotomicum]